MAADRLRQWVPNDPGFAALRRAARATLVIPVVFAFAKFVIGDTQTTTFTAFGCFALIVMADFGGRRLPRSAAFLTVVAVGVVLITLGTLASSVVWVATLAMLAVGFSIQFVGVFGGYVAAAQLALQLCFLLAVAVPVPLAALPSRLIGWLLAGLVSTLAGVFLWPRFEHLTLYRQAADACRALAALIDARRAQPDTTNLERPQETARAAVAAVRRGYAATPKRPAGPTRRDRAFVELLSDLGPMPSVASGGFEDSEGPPIPSSPRPNIAEAEVLADATVRALEGSADVLTGGPPPDLLALEQARRADGEALERWAGASVSAGAKPRNVLDGLNAEDWLWDASYLALVIGGNAVIVGGGQLSDDLELPTGAPGVVRGGLAVWAVRIIRTNLAPASSVLHQALRVGFGLALSVFLARTLALSYAFWVVLGALSVLQSNAHGTGRTTVQALIGTAVGVVVGALFTIVVGADSVVLWAALPCAMFLAVYAAGAINFVVGQAAFSVLFIILVNVIAPTGWRVGLARMEDVGVGVGVSVVVALLFWPRGARGELASSVAELYRAAAALLGSCASRLLDGGSDEDVKRKRVVAVRARIRAEEALELYQNERGAKVLDMQSAAFLVNAGTHMILAGDLLTSLIDRGNRAKTLSGEVTTLRTQAQVMLAGFLELADRLERAASPLVSPAMVSEGELRETALAALRHWQSDPEAARAAMAVVVTGRWIQLLGELATELQAPTSEAVSAARLPWWR